MRASLTIAAALSVLGASFTPAPAQVRVPRLEIDAENPLAIRRDDETVALPWTLVASRLPGATAGRVRVLDVAGREVVSQAVDNDGNGSLDELLFKGDFGARERRRFMVEGAPPAQPYAARVHVRHDPPRDDIAWESDRIAFRIYGEGLKKTPSAMSSSGIDTWVKSTRALILEKWYAKGHDAYHIDTGEGADFYDVGETLGNGGTAIWRNDTLYRADNFKAWRVIANGPIRAIFELRYDPWNAAGLTVSEVKRIAIDAGEHLYRQENTFTTADGSATAIPYAIGEVKRPGMVGIVSKAQPWAWLTGWGPVARKNGGHGEMGTAVLLPRDRVADWKETGNHYLAVSRAEPGRPVVHYVGAGWTDSGDFRVAEDWIAHLDRFAQRLAAPIAVTPATPAR